MTTVHDIGPYRVPDRVLGAVQEASRRTGIDFAYLMAKAATESAFRSDARAATSNATGLFQFINSTWLGMVRNHGHTYGLDRYAEQIVERPDGSLTVPDPAMRREILDLRNDPRLSAVMAAEYARENREHLERTYGGRIGPTELYMGHFLGADGASRFLNALRRDPQQLGAALFPAAAAANGPVFYDMASGRAHTLREIYALFDRRIGRDMAMVSGVPAAAQPVAGAIASAPRETGNEIPGGRGYFAARNAPAEFFQRAGASAPGFAARAPAAADGPGPAAPAAAHPLSAQGPGGAAGQPGARAMSLWTVLTASA